MNQFILYLLIGLGLGIPVFFIGLWAYKLYKNTSERRAVKKMIKQGKFLIPIDAKDYDVKAWENQKYGNIDNAKESIKLEQLNKDIFKQEEKEDDSDFE